MKNKLLALKSIEVNFEPVFYYNIILKDKNNIVMDQIRVKPSEYKEILDKINNEWIRELRNNSN